MNTYGFLSDAQCETAMCEYRQLQADISALKSYESATRLDDFYVKNLNKNSSLLHSVKLFLSLSHGQASIEKGFSVNKSMLREGLSENSIMAIRQVSINYDMVYLKLG